MGQLVNEEKNMISVQNLRKEFKKTIKEPSLKGSVKSLFKPKTEIITAVDNISFEVDKGEILGFIGPNGAGKSTVIKMLTGILTPTSGECMINGQIPYKNRKEYVKEIGVVFGQRTQLWWDLALRETYAVLKEIYEVSDKDYKERMSFLNEVLDLESFITSPVRTLSLGQRMRADIAASMLHNPKSSLTNRQSVLMLWLRTTSEKPFRKSMRKREQPLFSQPTTSPILNFCATELL